MRFVETSFLNPQKTILKFPDHYVALPVNMDDAGISANSDGKKIVPAGTIVGGGTLADDTVLVKVYKAATLTTVLTGVNNDMVFTSKIPGTVKVQYLDPAGASKALAVSVTVDTVIVSLATDGGSVITSTAAQIKTAIDAHAQASQMVSCVNSGADTGAGVVTALVATALTGGVSAEGVLLYDVDCTSGDMSGAMLVHGFVDLTKIPTAPDVQVTNSLAGRIVFID